MYKFSARFCRDTTSILFMPSKLGRTAIAWGAMSQEPRHLHYSAKGDLRRFPWFPLIGSAVPLLCPPERDRSTVSSAHRLPPLPESLIDAVQPVLDGRASAAHLVGDLLLGEPLQPHVEDLRIGRKAMCRL